MSCRLWPQDGPTGTVSGTVTLKDKTLTAGTVVFLNPDAGVGASGVVDTSGAYRIDSPVRTGTYQVAVQPPPLPAPHEMDKTPMPPKTDIPAKFQDPTTSGLSATVKEGANTVDLKL